MESNEQLSMNVVCTISLLWNNSDSADPQSMFRVEAVNKNIEARTNAKKMSLVEMRWCLSLLLSV